VYLDEAQEITRFGYKYEVPAQKETEDINSSPSPNHHQESCYLNIDHVTYCRLHSPDGNMPPHPHRVCQPSAGAPYSHKRALRQG
jgi:hypothetical protein